jgi:hypothetical protein
MQYKAQWEDLIPGEAQRMRVPHGWIVRTYTTILEFNKYCTTSEALVYVPDKEGEWYLEKK